MSKADRISGSFWLIFATIVCIASYRLGLGSLNQPGPGFIFFWIGIILCAMSLTVLLRSRRGRAIPDSGKTVSEKANVKKIILVSLSVFVYTLLLEKLGFIADTFLLFAFLLGIIEKKGWRVTLTASLLVTLAAHLVFNIWLNTQLPQGLFSLLIF
ncbi:tripartite tricarboxylate transporter TctB family protein [Thermodesulfobacteriota bacterium]